MKDSPEKISPLRRRMIEDMRMRKSSTKTQESYIRAVRHVAGFLGRAHRLSIRPGQHPARTPQKLGAWVQSSVRRIVLHLPATCLHRNDWQIIARNLGAAPA
jgi:hypothetical protein